MVILRSDLPTKGAGIVFVPAGEDAFLAGIKHDSFDTLDVKVAEETLVPTRKAEESHWRGHADVDTQHAGLHSPDELSRRGPVPREQRCAVPEAQAIHRRYRLVERWGTHQRKHRA